MGTAGLQLKSNRGKFYRQDGVFQPSSRLHSQQNGILCESKFKPPLLDWHMAEQIPTACTLVFIIVEVIGQYFKVTHRRKWRVKILSSFQEAKTSRFEGWSNAHNFLPPCIVRVQVCSHLSLLAMKSWSTRTAAKSSTSIPCKSELFQAQTRSVRGQPNAQHTCYWGPVHNNSFACLQVCG